MKDLRGVRKIRFFCMCVCIPDFNTDDDFRAD